MAELQIPQATFLDRLSEKLEDTVGAKAIFGAPIERDGTTVIPVARARWGIGGGTGTRMAREGDGHQAGTGGGGGGTVSPMGFIEVVNGCASFRPIRNPNVVTLAGTVLGVAALRAVASVAWASVARRRRWPVRRRR